MQLKAVFLADELLVQKSKQESRNGGFRTLSQHSTRVISLSLATCAQQIMLHCWALDFLTNVVVAIHSK